MNKVNYPIKRQHICPFMTYINVSKTSGILKPDVTTAAFCCKIISIEHKAKIYSHKNECIYKGIVVRRLVIISLNSEVVYFTSFVNTFKIINAFEHCITE